MQSVHVENTPQRADLRLEERPVAPRYERVQGLHLLRLSGDDYEMGYQHGELLREAIARGPVPYFETYVERMLASAVGPLLGSALGFALSATVGRKIAAGFPNHARRGLAGLA